MTLSAAQPNFESVLFYFSRIVDAFLKADETLGISDSALDEKKFLNLTDGIYQKILDYNGPDNSMIEAQKILQNIKNRNLYKCVHVARIKEEADLKKFKKDKTSLDKELAARDIEMKYGMDGKDPTEQVKFYTKQDLNTATSLKKQVSRLLPKSLL
ncbi:hypothetical protein GJAV_G00169280 [Gymnothorax javanicus]|nr:hypothetical protein GJAV_G00169280 [Gymnothorax javanicus]